MQTLLGEHPTDEVIGSDQTIQTPLSLAAQGLYFLSACVYYSVIYRPK